MSYQKKKESNRADWNISNSWLSVQLGEQAGDLSWTQQQIPPTPGHTCPAPGLSGQQIFCCNSGCGCQKRQSLIINKKLLCVARETVLVATNLSSWHHRRQETAASITFLSLFSGFSFLYITSNTSDP